MSGNKDLKLWLAKELYSAASKDFPGAGVTEGQAYNSISRPRKEFGDIGSSLALRIAKATGRRPSDVASALISSIGRNKAVSGASETGGYINVSLDQKEYAGVVLSEIGLAGDSYGGSGIGSGRKALVEYPAVNPNKPWHIGHLRNALLGDSISNIMQFCGYRVEREDYIDDLGLQIAESLWGYINMDGKPDKKFDQWLGERYVEVNRAMKERSLDGEIAGLLKKMEDVGSSESVLAREIASKCVEAQYATAYSYGIYHDVMVWESDIVGADLLRKALQLAMEKGALEKRDSGKNSGCVVLDLNKVRDMAKDFENPEETEKVLVRSDGTATYVAKDIAFHMWKLGIIDAKFKYTEMNPDGGRKLYSTSSDGRAMDFGGADVVVNIIGSAQRYPQLILKSVFSLMGYNRESDSIVHISYGEVSIDGGSLSGREGGWMGSGKPYTADSLLEEATKKALDATKESRKLSGVESEVKRIATAIGRSAIRFEFLRISPQKKVTFSWDTALNFQGNSGPYCMYTFARARSILKRAGYERMQLERVDLEAITRSYDFDLIVLLGEASEAVEKAASEYSPEVIADYLIRLTSAFSKFYESMKVIGSGDAERARLMLVDSYAQVARNMLYLLGMDAVESM